MDRSKQAGDNFLSGYNCAQSVTMAFADLMGMEESAAARLASPFGGGMGRMREVCGAVSGMLIVLGILYGYDTPGDDEIKAKLYTQVQQLAASFRDQMGTLLCREILDNPPSDPIPSARTEQYYKDRPCARVVMAAAAVLQEFIHQHPID
jgi:C_GCAxxG_C_C family probable redox protein